MMLFNVTVISKIPKTILICVHIYIYVYIYIYVCIYTKLNHIAAAFQAEVKPPSSKTDADVALLGAWLSDVVKEAACGSSSNICGKLSNMVNN